MAECSWKDTRLLFPIAVNQQDLTPGLVIAHWSSTTMNEPKVQVACGDSCALAMGLRFLATGSFERVAIAARR